MRDITLEDTFYHHFTTRAFATGIPTQLAGSPVLSVLKENNATPITAGVSVSVDRASVTGLNEATIVATAANGYESGKSYSIYISTGTVGGVSVVGEVVGQFTIQKSAAAVDLANGTDGLGALKSACATATGFATPTNITAGIITTVSGNVDGTVAGVTPEAAGVVPTTAEIKTAIEAAGSDLDYIVKALVNKAIWTEADGNLEMFNDAGASLGNIAAQIATDGTYTTRKRMVI